MAKAVRTPKPDFTVISEWINAGAMKTGYQLMFPTGKATEKAEEVPATKYNSRGFGYEGTTWLPKSQCISVRNDFYHENPGRQLLLVPVWLIDAKAAEGVEI